MEPRAKGAGRHGRRLPRLANVPQPCHSRALRLGRPQSPWPAMLPISVFIIAKNEADRIGDAIRAVRPFTDDLVVVDSGSTDGTQALAEELGARVVYNPWPGYGLQKRFG